VPGLAEKYRNSPGAWRETAKLFNQLAQKLKPQKMRIGYHNHTVEFQKLNGEIPWDIFCQNTRKEVITQLDIGHTVHESEYSATKRGAVIGDGDVKWQNCPMRDEPEREVCFQYGMSLN